MMPNIGRLTVRVVLGNAKALRSLAFAAEVLREIHEDMSWRDDAKEAAEALEYAIEHLRPEVKAS
jgi:hypothetical protein